MDRFPQDATAVVLTISDRCAAKTRQDLSGPIVASILTEAGLEVSATAIFPDEVTEIAHALRHYAATADLIVTTGGTGLALRDVTPEATRLVCDRAGRGLERTHARRRACSKPPWPRSAGPSADASGRP